MTLPTMTYMDRALYETVKQNLLTAAYHLSPTGKIQQAFVAIIHDGEEDGLSYKEVTIQLVNALHDGLCYGNWPSE